MIVERFLDLPAVIEFEHVTFQLQLFVNGPQDARLCYCIFHVSDHSPHFTLYNDYGSWKNPFLGSFCSFLFLQEGIACDGNLLDALLVCKQFLFINKLLS